MNAVEEPFADAEMPEYDGHEFAQYIEEQRVHAKNEEGYGHCRPTSLPIPLEEGSSLLYLDDEAEQQHGKTAGGEHETGTPDALVQRQPEAQRKAGDGKQSTENENVADFLIRTNLTADQFAAEETDHRVGNGRKRAHKTFRIDRPLVIEVVIAEQVQVDLCQHVRR